MLHTIQQVLHGMQQVLHTMQQVLYGMQQVCEFLISYIVKRGFSEGPKNEDFELGHPV